MYMWERVRGFNLMDEGLTKKDDDRKLSAANTVGRRAAGWRPAPRMHAPPRRTLKRIGVVIAVATVLYVLITNVPTDLQPRAGLRPNYGGPVAAPVPAGGREADGAGPSPSPAAGGSHNGPTRLTKLSQTLHAISATGGSRSRNRNVLFAAASLQSASTLLGFACQMGRERLNYVHFALMGRSDVETQVLKSINGIDESCNIIFHDARPNDAQSSSEEGMERAAFAAFYASDAEDDYFKRGAHASAKSVGSTLIQLPKGFTKSLMWITKLDSVSLRYWDKSRVDILIQATRKSSGGLVKLLASLSKVDFALIPIPHITIDLPHDIDPPTQVFLETFQWPPAHVPNPTKTSFLSLRHRILRPKLSEEESSVRFLESFWPVDAHSHVLVLSPQVEVAPHLFHYVKYALLSNRYSDPSRSQGGGDERPILGISLEQPLVLLQGQDKFSPPRATRKTGGQGSRPFLWQAPTSNAVLFMGEMWIELHDFVSRSLLVQRRSGKDAPAMLTDKGVSDRHPAWLQHVLRLCRARGYWFLYPGEQIGQGLVTVHRELYQLPEEYSADDGADRTLLPEGATDEEVEKAMQKYKMASEAAVASSPLLQGPADDASLPDFDQLPLVTWDGREATLEQARDLSKRYTMEFKRTVGRCAGKDLNKARTAYLADDLFCKAR